MQIQINDGRRTSRGITRQLFIALAVFSTILVSEGRTADSQETQFNGRYKAWDGWARQIWMGSDGKSGILAERAAAGKSGHPPLFELDNEVDMLGSALIALENGQAAVEMYNEWYGTLPERTPASIVLYARALRLQSLQLLAKPPRDSNPLEIFESAQQLMSKALNKLDALHKQLSDIANAGEQGRTNNISKLEKNNVGETSEATGFVSWINRGLPRPKSLLEVQNGTAQRERLPPFLAFEYIRQYLAWESQIARELGDMVYERTGSGLTVPAASHTGESGQSAVAAAYYKQARDILFLARLLDRDDYRLKEQASQLEKRIAWLRRGLPYGGEDFYQFDWYSPVNSVGYWSDQLTTAITGFQNLSRVQDQRRQASKTWAKQLQENDQSNEILKQQFKFQMNFELRSKRAELNLNLAGLKSRHAYDSLTMAYQETTKFIGESSYYLDATVYGQNLERDKARMQQEAERLVGEIRELGDMKGFLLVVSPDKGVPEQHREPEGVQRLRQGLSLVKSSFPEKWQSLKEHGKRRGRIDARIAERQGASIELSLARADLSHYEEKVALERLEKDTIPGIQKDLKGVVEELADWAQKYEKEEEAVKRGESYKQMHIRVLPGLQRELDRAAEQSSKARQRLEEFTKFIGATRKTMQQIKEARKVAAELYSKFKAIMDGASFTPVTITGPTGGGVSIDLAGSLEKLWRSTISAIDKGIQDLTANQDLDQLLAKLEKEGKDLAAEIEKVENEVNKKRVELLGAIDTSGVQGLLSLPDEALRAKVNDKIKVIRNREVFNRLSATVRDYEERSRKVFTGTLVESEGNRAVEAVSADARKKIEDLQNLSQEAISSALAEISKSSQALRKMIVEEVQDPQQPSNKDFARIWKQMSLARVELETKQAEIEASLAASQGRAAALRGSIGDHAREQLRKRVTQAELRELELDGQIESIRTRQETAWLEVAALAKLHKLAGEQHDSLRTLKDTFQTRMLELEEQLKKKKEEVLETDKGLLDAEKTTVDEINELAGELRRLNRPEGRIVTASMLDRLAPALESMERVDETNAEMDRQLTKANRSMVNYARWLYLFSGDRECTEYASRCDNLMELQIAKSSLDDIWVKVQKQFGNARAEMFAVTVSGKLFASADTPATNPSTAGMPLRLRDAGHPGPDKEANTLYLFGGNEPHFGDHNPKGMALAHLVNYETTAESGKAGGSVVLNYHSSMRPVFVGCIPVARWNDPVKPTEYKLRCVPSGRPSVPGRFATSRLPVWYPGTFRASTVFDTAPAAAGRLFKIYQEHIDVLNEPAETQLMNVEAFGRGLVGDYWLELEATKSGNTKPIPIDQLASVTLYFFYLDRTRDVQPKRIANVVRLVDLGLDDAAPNEIASAWDDPVRSARLMSQWKSRSNRTPSNEDYRLAIENQLSTVVGTHAYREDPGAIFQPVSLDRTLRIVSAIAEILFRAVKDEALEPLNAAYDALDKTNEARAHITMINNIVATENRLFSNLNEHARILSSIDRVLKAEEPNLAENKLLLNRQTEFSDEHLNEMLVVRVLEELADNKEMSMAARASAIQYVLDQLRAEYVEHVKKTSAQGKSATETPASPKTEQQGSRK